MKQHKMRGWFQRQKKGLQIALMAGIFGIEGLWLYAHRNEMRTIKDSIVFNYVVETTPPVAIDEETREKELFDVVFKDFKNDETELLVNDVKELRVYRENVWKNQENFSATILTAGSSKYENSCFMTPRDNAKEIIITGTATLDHLAQQTWLVAPKIFFESDVSDIFSPNITLDELVIDGKSVPQSLVHQHSNELKINNNKSPIFYVDCGELFREGILTRNEVSDGSLNVSYKARIITEKYTPVNSDVVGTMDDLQRHPEYNYLVQSDENEWIKYYKREDPFVKRIASILKQGKNNPLEIARACYDFTQRALEYDDKLKVPEVPVSIVRGKGKCVDYANTMITLLLACGIPAKEPQFLGPVITDRKIDGFHAWVEFLVPLKNGGYKWILSDPTWGDHPETNDIFFQCEENDKVKSERLYMIGFNVFALHADYAMQNNQAWTISNKLNKE